MVQLSQLLSHPVTADQLIGGYRLGGLPPLRSRRETRKRQWNPNHSLSIQTIYHGFPPLSPLPSTPLPFSPSTFSSIPYLPNFSASGFQKYWEISETVSWIHPDIWWPSSSRGSCWYFIVLGVKQKLSHVFYIFNSSICLCFSLTQTPLQHYL